MRVAVTGPLGYSGRYMTRLLLDQGWEVVGLTASPGRPNPFGGRVLLQPLAFESPERLTASLEGVQVLINTYWVRFDHQDFSHAQAVRHTETLFDAARRAGVHRVVHVSITNPDERSELPYFSGKARLERVLRESGTAHSILRPAVLFGGEDILINNIGWALRRFPLFAVFGDGAYRLQPIHVMDFAALAVREARASGNRVVEAIGPETFCYRDLVAEVGRAIGRVRPMFSVSPALGYRLGRCIGFWQRDTFITREEIAGLMQGRLHVDAVPAGWTRLSDWARENRESLGRRYASELARRRDRATAYG